MLTSTNDIIEFFEKEEFLQSLWFAWDGDKEGYWDTLYTIMQEAWDKFGESTGYISLDIIDEVRDFVAEKFEQEVGGMSNITNRIQTKSIGDFEAFLNEAKEANLSTVEVKKIIKSELEKLLKDQIKSKDIKDFLTKDDVKKMIRDTLVNQYKFLWQKSAFFINNI